MTESNLVLDTKLEQEQNQRLYHQWTSTRDSKNLSQEHKDRLWNWHQWAPWIKSCLIMHETLQLQQQPLTGVRWNKSAIKTIKCWSKHRSFLRGVSVSKFIIQIKPRDRPSSTRSLGGFQEMILFHTIYHNLPVTSIVLLWWCTLVDEPATQENHERALYILLHVPGNTQLLT